MATDLERRLLNRNIQKAARVQLSEADRMVLRQARRQRKIRVKVLARKLGVCPKTIIHYQAGERRPTPEMLQRWREAVL